MSFNDLPPELVTLVWTFVQPGDVLSLLLTCRRVRDLAGPCLVEHRQLQAQYSKVLVPYDWTSTTLFPFVDDPWNSAYPKSLEILHAPYRPEIDSVRTSNEVHAHIKDLVHRTGFPLFQEGDSIYPHDIVMALSIWMLPSLECIEMKPGPLYNIHGLMLPLARSLVHQIVRGRDRTGDLALRSLSSVSVVLSGSQRDQGVYFETFEIFLTLPSLRILKAANLYLHEAWTGPNHCEPCGVTHLLLSSCFVTAEPLDRILRRCANLKNFEYSHHCSRCTDPLSRPAYGHSALNYEIDRILHILAKYAAATLQTLALDLDCFKHISLEIGSLRPFASLKKLLLSKRFLLEENRVPRIVDVMPSSLQELEVRQWHEFQFSEPSEGLTLLSGLPAMRESHLPALRRVILGSDKPHVEIDILNSPGTVDRDEAKLKRDFFSYVNSYDPKNPLPNRYTLAEYITWVRYRSQSSRKFLAERTQWVAP